MNNELSTMNYFRTYGLSRLSVSFIVLLFLLLFLTPSYAQHGDTVIIVHFASNAFTPDTGEIQKLDSFFTTYHNTVVLAVSGHADTVGIEKNNLRLSARRSQFVVDLLKKYSRAQTPVVESFGETKPASAFNNSLNRRVEIKIRYTYNTNDSADASVTTVIKKYSFDKLYFQPDKAVIENYSIAYVDEIARMLKNYPGAHFEIRGHVNCPLTVDKHSGYMQKMNQLSVDRAYAVYAMLADRGIPAAKMTYKGMGNTEMIFTNASTDDEKRKNMRVEILVLQ